MLIKRKQFLKIGSLASASAMMPKFLKAFETGKMVPLGNKVLVILQLSGGNDGLNTVIPVRNDIYYRERKTLAIKQIDTLRLNDDAALNSALTAFKDLYDNGDLAILNSVGYPNPDRSHFRSMDIWHSASASDQYVNTGWVGRYLDAQCKGCDRPTKALEVDDTLSLALKGEGVSGLAFQDPRKLYSNSNEKYYRDLKNAHAGGEETADYLYKVMGNTINSADYIFQQSKLHPSKATYPMTETGRNLKTISGLIMSDIDTKVYYLSVGSFDTHVGQANQQKRLFTEINNAVKAFTDDLKANGRFDDVLLMTFSEFGRRVAQNASNGTDHGTANNMFFVGGGLKQQGLLNAMPDLSDLNNGDLKHTVDFKNVYATVLNNWLGTDDKKILNGKFDRMSFI